ncbi:MAG: hypothetical protein M0036_24065 [Desulfobacteraceae bacterium]|nr:hypothetical protein [Desulfobacteraceae bacterium]
MTFERMMRRRLIALFLFSVVLFSYPIMSLFNQEILVFGFPLLYVYLFLLWTVLIVAIALISRAQSVK